MGITGLPPYDAAHVTAWINAPGPGQWSIERLTAISEGRNRRMAAHACDGFATPIFLPPPPGALWAGLSEDFIVGSVSWGFRHDGD